MQVVSSMQNLILCLLCLPSRYFFSDFTVMGRLFAMLVLSFLSGCRSTSYPENDFSNILRQVEELSAHKHYAEAIALLKENDPYSHLDLLEALAFSYEANGQFLLAAQTFEQLFFADTDKKYTESAFYAAQVYTQLDYWYAASRCYRLYIDIHFKDADLWFALAEAEEKLDQISLALTAYLNGVQHCKKKTSDMLSHMAQLCYKNQMWDEAAFWAQEYLKISGNNAEILQILLNVADKHNDRQVVKFYVAELQKVDTTYLEKYPDVKLKYMDEEISKKTLPVEDFPHEIHSTNEEIERTLACFSVTAQPLELSIPRKINLPTYLCPRYIY